MPVCSRCTYENEFGATRCEMCGSENLEEKMGVAVGACENVSVDDDAEFARRLQDSEHISTLGHGQKLTDEEFARKLQEEEDLEEARERGSRSHWSLTLGLERFNLLLVT